MYLDHPSTSRFSLTRKETTMSTDPVCGMTVDDKTAPASAKYAGKTIYFCSKECKDQFNQNPEAYAAETAKTT